MSHCCLEKMYPGTASRSKPRSRLGSIKLTQVTLHQAEGLLNEFVELVDAGQRVNTDDAEGLFETRGKVERGNGHLFYQSINPPKSGAVDAVQAHEHQEEVLLNSTEGLVGGEQIVALCQHLLLPTWAKEQVCSYHGHCQFVCIDLRALLPACEHWWVGERQGAEERGNVLLCGTRGVAALQHISQASLWGLHTYT